MTKLPEPVKQRVIVDGKDITELWAVTNIVIYENDENDENDIAKLTTVFRYDSAEFDDTGGVIYNLSTLSKNMRKD